MLHAALLALALPLAILGAGPASSAPRQEERGRAPTAPRDGLWQLQLRSPGGQLPFLVEVGHDESGAPIATVRNGAERIARPIESRDANWAIRMAPYDSELVFSTVASGEALVGEWIRPRGDEEPTRMALTGRLGETRRFAMDPLAAPPRELLDGRWRVRFSSFEDPAVGLFFTRDDGALEATFLTTTGDFRYLEGLCVGNMLWLSCFDGAHAFLLRARLADDGTLSGDFWSRDTWHETWTAERDAEARLPDPFGLSSAKPDVPLAELRFPDLAGEPRALDDPAFAGRARILVLFGSWCPNCKDASELLAELARRYGERGLGILGLAFEFEASDEARLARLARYVADQRIDYPVLVAGPADKAAASAAFPLLDRVRAFPTFLFLDAQGAVEAVYTGFSGPATGAAHERLREQFEARIEELLARGDD